MFNNSNFFFALAIQSENDESIGDKTYFVHYFTYYLWERKPETQKMELKIRKVTEMEKCNSNHVDPTKINGKIEEYYCANFDNLLLGGDFVTSEKYTLIKFSIDRCSIYTEMKHNITCKTDKEVLEKYRDLTHVTSYIQKTKIDQNNNKKPIVFLRL